MRTPLIRITAPFLLLTAPFLLLLLGLLARESDAAPIPFQLNFSQAGALLGLSLPNSGVLDELRFTTESYLAFRDVDQSGTLSAGDLFQQTQYIRIDQLFRQGVDVTPAFYGGPGEPYVQIWAPLGGVLLDGTHYATRPFAPDLDFNLNVGDEFRWVGVALAASAVGLGVLPAGETPGGHEFGMLSMHLGLIGPGANEFVLDASGTQTLPHPFHYQLEVRSLLCADSGGPVLCGSLDAGEGPNNFAVPDPDFLLHTRDTGSITLLVVQPVPGPASAGLLLLGLGALAARGAKRRMA